MRLGDILELVNTSQAIKIINNCSGKEFYPTYREINIYSNNIVVDIRSNNNTLEVVTNPSLS